MRFLVKAKTIAISTILLAAMIFPTLATAQRSDLFFKVENDDIYNDRDFTFNLNVNGTGNEPFGVPLGSGLLVMTLAGAGYAVARRRRSLRKGTMLLLACALILGTTQCKKRIETITSNNVNTIQYTLNVGNGTRHIINPNENGYVPVRYDVNDVIYVGDGAKYLGYLTCVTASDEHGNNAQFTGTIAEPSGNTLYFYFVGGLTPSVTLVENTTTEFTVDISDQGTKLPVLSMAAVTYDGATAADCTLRNKCALVEFKFTPGVATSKKVKISNMYTEAKIDFVNHSITHTEKLDAVNLYRANTTDNWAILMYNDVERSAMGMVYRENGGTVTEPFDIYDYYDGVIIPELSADNNYLYGSTAVSVANTDANKVSNKVFVVSPNANAVRFAHGNLKCTKNNSGWDSGYTWSFLSKQYDLLETGATTVSENYANENAVSHFGWGCTGHKDSQYASSQSYFMPYNTASYTYNAAYGPTGAHNLSLLNGSDWGAYITEDNHEWRLLTKDEWKYMLSSRHNALGLRGTVRITDIPRNGAIFFPQDCTTIPGGFIIGDVAWANSNLWTAEQLDGILAASGALFLPVTGYRNATSIKSVTSYGYYWSSTYSDDEKAWYFYVGGSSGTDVKSDHRAYGRAVRLAY